MVTPDDGSSGATSSTPEPVSDPGDPSTGGSNGVDVEPAPGGAPDQVPEDPGPVSAEPEPAVDVPVMATSGCAANAAPLEGEQTIDVDGTERSYIVSLPDGYDPETPYPLVFAFHGLGGSAELVSGRFYFGLEVPEGKPTIFVYPQGLDTGSGAGWANSDGEDVAFFDALLVQMEADYCVDSERVFSTGHSYGAIMTHTLGCERASVLRAIAPVAGAFFGGFGGDGCSGPVAAWGAHGSNDGTVDYDSGLSAIQRVMETNGCDPNSGTPVEPTEFCTLYDCDPGYPVTWCVHQDDHNWPDFAAASIRAFFDSF
jgi:poly(3-hydroxybutyrate) depolymerase